MTFIMAQRFGKRILLLADTKISNPKGILRRGELPHAHNNVPGRLKIFPISLYLSVGYAGNSGKALNDLRRFKNGLNGAPSLLHCLQALQLSSAEGDIDYLLISHVEGPEIYKIAHGNASFGQAIQWIGDRDVAPLIQSAVQQARERRENSGCTWDRDPEYGCQEEEDLRAGWVNLLLTAPTLTASVGGIPIQLLGSPYGHSFLSEGGAYNPGSFFFTATGATDETGRPVNPLASQYSYSIVPSAERGVPVVGLWLQEAHSAYLYDPMLHDEAVLLPASDAQGLGRLVKERALHLGGEVVQFPPLSSHSAD